MKVTLLGFTVTDEDLQEILAHDSNMPTQTHNFAWAVVEALRSSGTDVTLLSVEPVSNYPANPRWFFRGGVFSARGVEGRKLPFVNTLVLKHASRFVACASVGTSALREWRPDVLLVHGVHSPFLFYARICRRLFGLPVAVILTDPPGVVLPTDSPLARRLKGLDISLVRMALSGFDGVVALTESLASHFAPGVAHLVMEGIVEVVPPPAPEPQRVTTTRAIYAGGLSAAYGVGRLVDAVRALNRDDVTLSCFGRGELEDWITRVAEADQRIDPPRLVSREQLLAEYAQSDLLVQPRPVDQDFVRFSFPSKLLEYLASGIPVLSTRLPGIPADYEDHVHWADDDSTEGLQAALARVLSIPKDERERRAARARDFIRTTRGYEAQGKRLTRFLAKLVGRSAGSDLPPPSA